MKVICEFDMAKPKLDDKHVREKSRIIEDENGIWRIQSKCPDEREVNEYRRVTYKVTLTQDEKDGWKDEFRMGEDWPAGEKIGNIEYPTRVLNMSSILKAVFSAGGINPQI